MEMMIGPCGNSGNFMIHSFCMDSFSEWSARRHFFVYAFVVTSSIQCIYPNECSFDSNSTDSHKTYFECVFFIQVSFVGRFWRTVLSFSSQSITHSLCISSDVQTNMMKKINTMEKNKTGAYETYVHWNDSVNRHWQLKMSKLKVVTYHVRACKMTS